MALYDLGPNVNVKDKNAGICDGIPSAAGWRAFVCDLCIYLHALNKNLNVKMWTYSYPSVLWYAIGTQKNLFIVTVLLSTHKLCFGWEIIKQDDKALLHVSRGRWHTHLLNSTGTRVGVQNILFLLIISLKLIRLTCFLHLTSNIETTCITYEGRYHLFIVKYTSNAN